MVEPARTTLPQEWTHEGARLRRLRAGADMTPAERLAWLEEMLDELLPLLGRAQEAEDTGG